MPQNGFMDTAVQASNQRQSNGQLYDYQQNLLRNYGSGDQTKWQRQTAEGLMNQGYNSGVSNSDLYNQGADTNTVVRQNSVDLSGVTSAMNDGFAQTNENVNSGFAQTNENLSQVNTNVASGFGDMQTNQEAILSGQSGFADTLSDMGGKMDTYYQGLAGGQQDLQDQVGGLQSGFTDFRDDYDTQSALAQDTRMDTQDMISSGFDDTQAGISNLNEQNVQTQDAVSQIARGGGGFAGTATQAQSAPAQGAAPQQGVMAPQGQQAAAQPQNPIQSVRRVLRSQGGNLPPDARRRMFAVTSAFDSNGRLIPEQPMPDGTSVFRQLQGDNLSITRMDDDGQTVGQSVLNVSQVLQEAQSFAQMGSTPYQQTAG